MVHSCSSNKGLIALCLRLQVITVTGAVGSGFVCYLIPVVNHFMLYFGSVASCCPYRSCKDMSRVTYRVHAAAGGQGIVARWRQGLLRTVPTTAARTAWLRGRWLCVAERSEAACPIHDYACLSLACSTALPVLCDTGHMQQG